MRPFEAARMLLEMRRDQWLSREELEALQARKLERLLAHASRTTKHYRGLAGVRIRDISDLSSVPILQRASVRDDPDSFISSDFERKSLTKSSTSGSSGVQVPLFGTPAEEACGIAFECHHMFENGIGLLDSQARITHFVSAPNIFQRMGIMRCSYISVQKSEGEMLRELKSLKPRVLSAYPSIVRSIALANDGLKLKMVFTGGELLRPEVRSIAEKSFGCPVRDRYGSMESSWVAWECEKGRYHVHSDQAILEVVDDEGKPLGEGRVGRIVVTPLWRKAMIFLRYELGDRGALGGKCPCGRGLHVLSHIEGRDDDFVVLPSGRLRSARTINLMDDISEVLSYQIIQEKPDLFVFRHVPAGKSLGDALKAEIAGRISSGCLGEAVRVEFEEVSGIAKGKTGKIKTVISKVKSG